MSTKILLVGGGTGGHFYPTIAVAETLKNINPSIELYYMGPDQYDSIALAENSIKFIYCPAGKMRIYPSLRNFFDFFKNIFGIFVAVFKLYAMYPDVIFSKGSYTSVPVIVAAIFLRIPLVIHESDTVPGRANLLAKKFARYIAISYSEASPYFDTNRTALIGIPIRKSIIRIPENPFTELGIPEDLPLIYVTGGSLGAERINNIIIKSLNELLPYYRIFHQVGGHRKNEITITAKAVIKDKNLLSRYFVADKLNADSVSALLSAASIIITRAGSTSLFEIAQHGRPSIVIPIPENISRDQRSNAYAYARSGAAIVIEENNLTETILNNEISTIMNNESIWTNMSLAAKNFSDSGASEKIATILISICEEHKT